MNSICEKQPAAVLGTSRAKVVFETFVNEHMKDAYFIALGLIGNHEDALELSQEAFYRAYRNFNQLNKKDKLFPWFYQILRNLCFSHLRKRRTRQSETLSESKDGEMPAEVNDYFNPEAVAQRNETKDRIWKAISQLDDKHREVIILRHFRNLSYDEMANILFCNKGTITSRLYYARKKLKEILDSEKGGQI